MMSEAKNGDESGGFEIVEKEGPGDNISPPSMPSEIPPPSALPSFGNVPPPPSAFPPPPRPLPPPVNPYAAGAASAAPPKSTPPPGPQIGFTPLPPSPKLPPKESTPPASALPPAKEFTPPASSLPPLPKGRHSPDPRIPTASTAAISLDVPEDSGEDQGDGEGMWNWIKSSVSGSEIVNKLAEKAKTSVDSMITTLDPQMKDYMLSSGTVELAVASDQEHVILGVKDGFLRAFANVDARGLGTPGQSSLPAQSKGLENGVIGAKDRAAALRNSGLVPKDIPIVSVEGVVFEAAGNTFEADCVFIEDPATNFRQFLFSQFTPLSAKTVENLTVHTPKDYAHARTGYAITVGQAVAEESGVEPREWKEWAVGLSSRQSLIAAASALAFAFKRHLSQQAALPAISE